MKLDQFQRGASDDRSNNRVVVAPAGSGKTSTLVSSIIEDLKSGIPASSMLVLTFTNQAASEIRDRVSAALSQTTSPDSGFDIVESDLTVGTFHSWCMSVIREAPRLVGRRDGVTVYDDQDRAGILRRVAENLGVKVGNRKGPDAILNKIDQVSKKTLTISGRPLGETARLAYSSALRRHNALDFDMMIEGAYQIVRLSLGLPSEAVQHGRHDPPMLGLPTSVYVDEYQDTDHRQHELMELLRLEGGAKMFRVGDIAQCIYGWRSAKPEIFSGLRDSDASLHTLRINYRSVPDIVGVGATIAGHVGGVTDVSGFRGGAGCISPAAVVSLCVHRDDDFASEDISKRISAAIKQGVRSVMVIGRTWGDLYPIESSLKSMSIPHRMVRRVDDAWNSRLCRFLVSCCRLVLNQFDSHSARMVSLWPTPLSSPLYIDELDAAGQLNARAVIDGLTWGSSKNRRSNAFKVACEELELFNWDTEDHHSIDVVRFADSLLSSVVRICPDGDTGDGWSSRVSELLSMINDWRDRPSRNKRYWKRSSTIRDFVDWWTFRRIQDSNKEESLENDFTVSLGTVHAFKGLEADIVHVVGLEEGFWPRRGKSADELEEEKRLMYVSATRARDRLVLHTSGHRQAPFGNRGTKVSCQPSSLIQLLPVNRQSMRDVLTSIDPAGEYPISAVVTT